MLSGKSLDIFVGSVLAASALAILYQRSRMPARAESAAASAAAAAAAAAQRAKGPSADDAAQSAAIKHYDELFAGGF